MPTVITGTHCYSWVVLWHWR